MTQALCEARGISVAYPGSLRWANRECSLSLRPGEVVALVGENGAGKSTLLSVLYGLLRPGAGEVRYHGQPVEPSPERAIAAGIGLVHQHFMLVPRLSVAENVVLGREPRRAWGVLDRARAERETAELGERYGLAVDPRRTVSELSVGEAQRVEILKTLYRGARLLLLDEPTAVLTPGEVERLLEVLRRLVDEDEVPAERRGLLLVTHKLDEVMAVADRVVVMRRGEVVQDLPRAECSMGEVARAMVGRELHPVTRSDPHPDPLPRVGEGDGRQVKPASLSRLRERAGVRGDGLEVAGLSVARDGVPAVSGVSLSVRPGEILGLAGVEGNGQAELCAALVGLLPATGMVRVGGIDVSRMDVAARRRAGLGWVPEDRHRHGLVLDFSLSENVLLGQIETSPLWLDLRGLRERTAALLAEYGVTPPDPDAAARSLSGGNQQKLVIGRALLPGAAALVVAQPTRGVDIGAIEAIHRKLLLARDAGCAILLVSAELDELRALADRVAVMYRGRIVATLDNPPERLVSRDHLGELMTGAAS